MSKTRRRIFRAVLLIFWMGVIYYFSDQANSNACTEEIFGTGNYFARKLAHVTEYAILCLFFYLFFSDCASLLPDKASSPASGREPLKALALCLLCSFLYACGDEWHQSFVPGRSALFSDVLIDTSGALTAALALFFKKQKIT